MHRSGRTARAGAQRRGRQPRLERGTRAGEDPPAGPRPPDRLDEPDLEPRVTRTDGRRPTVAEHASGHATPEGSAEVTTGDRRPHTPSPARPRTSSGLTAARTQCPASRPRRRAGRRAERPRRRQPVSAPAPRVPSPGAQAPRDGEVPRRQPKTAETAANNHCGDRRRLHDCTPAASVPSGTVPPNAIIHSAITRPLTCSVRCWFSTVDNAVTPMK